MCEEEERKKGRKEGRKEGRLKMKKCGEGGKRRKGEGESRQTNERHEGNREKVLTGGIARQKTTTVKRNERTF
jgi:hypothetical protein